VGEELFAVSAVSTFDQAALGQIYDAYYERIYNYIYHRLGDATLAEDMAGEVFLRMLESVRVERAWRTSLTGWLYRIAHNLVIDYYRRRGRRDEGSLDERIVADDRSGSPRVSLETMLTQQQLRTALYHLTDEQQEVVILKFGEDLSNAEIAEIMGKTEGAVKALQHRALTTLRRVMEEGR
jgi:RNA polymerase sigma-70 factor, ECF subfamily